MDSSLTRREALEQIARHHAQFQASHGDMRVYAVCDDETEVYSVLYAGWDGRSRVHGMLLFLRLDGEKVIVEYDGIYHGVYNDLIAAGIPADDIVLAFRSDQPSLQTTG